MVSGGIFLEGHTDHMLADTGFHLVQDITRPHVAGVCRQFLDDDAVDAIDWPSYSPDLNQIENLWYVMHQCRQMPQTVQELIDALIQVWELIPRTPYTFLCNFVLNKLHNAL